jgi:hypothetical protein
MARTVAPLLSFSAAGQIAKTQVYSRWKGRPYVRRYAIPSNPRTTEQTLTRDTFKWLNAIWRYYPEAARAAWALYAVSRQFTDRNAFIKQNLPDLREEADLTNIIISPSALSGLAAAGMVLTAGANKITVALTAPLLPTGWTITSAHAAAIPQQDPQTGTNYSVGYAFDASAPYSFDITGLTTAQEYVVGGWFEFMRDDGKTAYGPSIQDTETPS